MSKKMIVTFYRKELTWYGYEVEVEATSNEEAVEKIKDDDYEHIDTTDEECDSVEGYGVFYFPDGEETMVPTDTSNYPDEEITLAEIRTELMRYLDNRANRGRS